MYDTGRIVVSIGRSRGRERHGLWAYIVPLRGKTKHGAQIQLSSEAIARENPHALYLVNFLFPRFAALSPQDRLETMLHELYHIAPMFDGTLREFSGAHRFHGPTPNQFDLQVKKFASEVRTEIPYLLSHPLLVRDFAELSSLKGRRLKNPDRHILRTRGVEL